MYWHDNDVKKQRRCGKHPKEKNPRSRCVFDVDVHVPLLFLPFCFHRRVVVRPSSFEDSSYIAAAGVWMY
jgi:hypothetical protein